MLAPCRTAVPGGAAMGTTTMQRFIAAAAGRASRLALAVISLATALPAPAVARHDHDNALLAVERGEALSLAVILERVRGKLGGEVVGVSFEHEGGRWIYEFRVIDPAGRLSEVHVDAATADIINRDGE